MQQDVFFVKVSEHKFKSSVKATKVFKSATEGKKAKNCAVCESFAKNWGKILNKHWFSVVNLFVHERFELTHQSEC